VTGISRGRRVAILLAAGIVGVAVVAAVASFALSFDEAKEFQDDALQQIAAMATSRTDDDAQSRITVLHVPREPLPAWLPRGLPAGLHMVEGPERSIIAIMRNLTEASPALKPRTSASARPWRCSQSL